MNALGTLSKSSVLGIGGEGGERSREKRAQTLMLVEMGTHLYLRQRICIKYFLKVVLTTQCQMTNVTDFFR